MTIAPETLTNVLLVAIVCLLLWSNSMQKERLALLRARTVPIRDHYLVLVRVLNEGYDQYLTGGPERGGYGVSPPFHWKGKDGRQLTVGHLVYYETKDGTTVGWVSVEVFTDLEAARVCLDKEPLNHRYGKALAVDAQLWAIPMPALDMEAPFFVHPGDDASLLETFPIWVNSSVRTERREV